MWPPDRPLERLEPQRDRTPNLLALRQPASSFDGFQAVASLGVDQENVSLPFH
jgi:hypothetical protein